MAENVQDPKAEESVKPEVKPKSEKSKSSEKVKPEGSKVEEVVTEHLHHHHEHVRRQKLYDDYWKDKVKDPTDNRHPSEYIQGWWYPHG